VWCDGHRRTTEGSLDGEFRSSIRGGAPPDRAERPEAGYPARRDGGVALLIGSTVVAAAALPAPRGGTRADHDVRTECSLPPTPTVATISPTGVVLNGSMDDVAFVRRRR